MAETLLMTEQEILRRNRKLRWKKRGMQVALCLLMLASCAVILLLQRNEDLAGRPLYIFTSVVTLLLLGAVMMYRRFARLLAMDMQSQEKIVAIGIVVRSNYIGNIVYPTWAYGRSGQKYITLDVDGKWLTLSGIQVKRLLPHVVQANRIYLRDRFLMEFTPHGRHLMHMERL